MRPIDADELVKKLRAQDGEPNKIPSYVWESIYGATTLKLGQTEKNRLLASNGLSRRCKKSLLLRV